VTKSSLRNWQVFCGVTLLTSILSVAWLGSVELSDENIRMPLRQTARLAFVLYLVVLVARPLQQLLHNNRTAVLLRNRRLIGVAFTAVMTTHLGLIVYRYASQADLDLSLAGSATGIATYAVFYLMFITSFDAPRAAIGPKPWKFLHRTGLVLAAFIFALPHAVEDLSDPGYLIFGIPFAIAMVIRLTAWLRSRQPGS